jgi:hypothetical protein
MTTQREISARWRTSLGRGVLGVMAALGLLAAAPGAAHAGSYKVDECTSHAPSGPDAVYTVSSPGAYNLFQAAVNCTAFGMSLSPSQAWGGPVYGVWTATAPPGTTILSGDVKSFISDTQSGGAAQGSGWDGYTASYNDAGTRTIIDDIPEGTVVGHLPNSPQRSVAAVMNCGGASGCGPPGGIVFAQLKDVQLTLADSQAPKVTGFGGELSAGGSHSGTADLTVSSSDVGSGVSDVIIKVNGSEIGRPPVVGCNADSGAAYQFSPCPSAATVSIPAVNTDASPWQTGANTLEACPRDYSNGGSGPNVGACASTRVYIDNSCPASTGPTVATNVDAGLRSGKSSARSSLAIKSTDETTVSGRLSGPSGAVAGATVCVYERLDLPDQDRVLVTTTNSHRDGGFEAQVPPGPSRVLDVVYRYNDKQVESGHLQLDSTVIPDLRLMPRHLANGENLRFKGQIPGPFNGGRAITLQARVGHTWRTFKQLQSRDGGVFTGRYKFKNSTLSRARYTFRARVKSQNGYPYEPGSSKRKSVIVHG